MNVWGQILDNYTRTAPVKTGIVVPSNMKVCTKCKECKPKSEFYVRPLHGAESVTSACKRCLIDASTKRNEKKKVKK